MRISKLAAGSGTRKRLSVGEKIGWVSESCQLGRDFGGWAPVLLVRDPTDKKKFGPEKIEKKRLKFLFHVAVSEKYVFLKNGAILAPGAPYRAVRTEKDGAVFRPPVGEYKIPAWPTVLD